ncbi:MAG: VWA-like domain-containing protein [Thermoanaerobacterales bacterium]|nr:VWA-like domain-containing protein [Bacillota bacterium]MDI6906807.1 VWA-like domain-containing protein [Thermoanaerobacterales bacterium]
MLTLAKSMRQDLEDIKALLFLRAPFLGLLLRKMRLLVHDRIETVGATSSGEVIVNPFFWSGLDGVEAKTFILLHEALHLAFGHPWQVSGKDRELWNLSTDMVVNEMLFVHGYDKAAGQPVTAAGVRQYLRTAGRDIGLEDLRRASAAEVYRLLEETSAAKPLRAPEGMPRDLLDRGPEPGGQVVQDGGLNEGDDPETHWLTAVAEALVTARQAGLMPGDLARAVKTALRPQIDWRRQLRGSLQEGVGRTVVTTWQRPSRRYESFPGVKRLGLRTIWTLVDCSGSIDDHSLGRFLTEVWSLSRVQNCTLRVIPWDAQAYPVVTVNTATQVRRRLAPEMRGGGGTVLAPALAQLARHMAPQDMVVILSDGHIADLGDAATLRLYRRLAARAARMVFVTTDRDPALPRTRLILMK